MTAFVIRTNPELPSLDGARFATMTEAREAIARCMPDPWFLYPPGEVWVCLVYRTPADAVANAYGTRPWFVVATIEQRNHEAP